MDRTIETLIAVLREQDQSTNGWVHKPSLVVVLAHKLKELNSNFNIEAFVKACGVESMSLEEASRPMRNWDMQGTPPASDIPRRLKQRR